MGLRRKLRHRGGDRADWIVIFTAAPDNMVRMRRLLGGDVVSMAAARNHALR